MTSTAYHPQTDGLSERSNQTVEIALRYIITNYPDLEWWKTLPSLQAQLNNSPNASTGLAPNEINYGFKVQEVLSLLDATDKQPMTDNLADRRLEHRAEATEATAFAMAKAKMYYDTRHMPLLLRPGDKAYLRLHHGYELPGKPSRKLSPQRCGPFTVKRRVGRLAYELELPPAWRVHPVISIAQLEPAPVDKDPYERPRPTHPDSVEVEGDTEEWKSYEVEKVVKKRIRRYGNRPIAQYLIRWLGYGPEYDEWRSLSALGDCMELVEEFEAFNAASPTSSQRRAAKTVRPTVHTRTSSPPHRSTRSTAKGFKDNNHATNEPSPRPTTRRTSRTNAKGFRDANRGSETSSQSFNNPSAEGFGSHNDPMVPSGRPFAVVIPPPANHVATFFLTRGD